MDSSLICFLAVNLALISIPTIEHCSVTYQCRGSHNKLFLFSSTIFNVFVCQSQRTLQRFHIRYADLSPVYRWAIKLIVRKLYIAVIAESIKFQFDFSIKILLTKPISCVELKIEKQILCSI